jgi:hypothetical protein
MRRTATVLAVALLVPGALAATAGTAAAGGRPLATVLTGAAEVPGPGDPDGTGKASIRVNPGQREVCYTLTVSGIAPATGAHIHEAPAGEAGRVVVHLAPPADGSSSGCTEVSREFAKELIKNPEQYYVNVHNAEFPAGALRGQLG